MYRQRLTFLIIVVEFARWTLLAHGENTSTLSVFENQPVLGRRRDSDPMVRMWKKQGEVTKEWNNWEHYSGDGPPENWDPHRKSLRIKSDVVPSSVVIDPIHGTPVTRDISSSFQDKEPSTESSYVIPIIPTLQSSFVEDWSPLSSQFEGDLTRTSLPYEGPSSLFEMTAVMSSIVPTPSSSTVYPPDSPTFDSSMIDVRVPSASASPMLPITEQLEPSSIVVPEETMVESSIFTYTTPSLMTKDSYISSEWSPILNSNEYDETMSTSVSFSHLYSTFIESQSITISNFVSSPASIGAPVNYQSFSYEPENIVSSVVFSPSPSFGEVPFSSQVLTSTTFIELSSVRSESESETLPQNSSELTSPMIENSEESIVIPEIKVTMSKFPYISEYLTPSVVIILVPSVHIVESWDIASSLEKETIDIVQTPANYYNTATWYGLPSSSRLMIQSSDIDTPIFSENEPVAPKVTQETDTSVEVSFNESTDSVQSTSFRVPRSLDPNEASEFSVSHLDASETATDVISPSPSSDMVVVIPETSVTEPDIASVGVEPSRVDTIPDVTPSLDPSGPDSKIEDPKMTEITSSVVEPNDKTLNSNTPSESVVVSPETTETKREGVHDEESLPPTESKLTTSASLALPEVTPVATTFPPEVTPVATTIPPEDIQTTSLPADKPTMDEKNDVDTAMSSLNLETSTTLTAKTEPPPYLLDKAYWIRTIIVAESHKWKPYTWEDLPRRLERAYKLAHRRNSGMKDRRRRSVYEDAVIKVKLVGWAVDAIHGRTELWYVIAVDDVAVRATLASDIFKLLTKEEMEKDVGFDLIVPAEPFKKEAALISASQGRQWVILVAIAVTGLSVSLLVCGALAYYRCCKKRPKTVSVDPESEPSSPSYGFRNVEQALQEGTVTLSVVKSSEGEGDKTKKPKTEEIESKRPLPNVPGTSTSSSDSDIAVIKAKSKRFRTLLENESTQTENGIVNPAFEDSPIGTSRRKHARKAIKANGNASVSSDNNGYFDHVTIPSPPTSPHETDTLPSTAPLPPQQEVKEVKDGRGRRHSNKVSASPPDVLPTEIKVQEKINELLDDTIAKTTGRRLYNSARSKRIQPERGDGSLSPGFQSFRSPKQHKKGAAAFGDKHNSVCETLAENELSGKEDSSAPKVVWSTFKGESPAGMKSPTGSEDSRPGERQSSFAQTEPLFLHSDKHPSKQSGSVRDTPMTAPSSTSDSPTEPGLRAHRGSLAASAPVLVDVHEKEGLDPEDYIGAVKVTEPAQSVIKAIRDELKKFNSSLPGTSSESNA